MPSNLVALASKMFLSNSLYLMCSLTHSKVCLNRHQSGENHELTNQWGWLEQQAHRAYAWVLRYGLPSYDNTTETERVTIPGRTRINKNQEYFKKKSSTQIFTRGAISKEWVSQIFFPANLNLEKKKKDSHHSHFCWTLQAEIQKTDMVRILTFCQGLSEVPRYLSSSSPGAGSDQPVKLLLPGSPTVGEKTFLLYSFRFFGW